MARHSPVGFRKVIMTEGKDQAFPDDIDTGLTKREWFAGIICAGVCANSGVSDYVTKTVKTIEHSRQTYAESAVAQADALIVALNKTK